MNTIKTILGVILGICLIVYIAIMTPIEWNMTKWDYLSTYWWHSVIILPILIGYSWWIKDKKN
jgi:hypothetical protein